MVTQEVVESYDCQITEITWHMKEVKIGQLHIHTKVNTTNSLKHYISVSVNTRDEKSS